MSLKYAAVGEEQGQEGTGNGEHGPDHALNESFELNIQSQKFPEVPTGPRQRNKDSDFKPMQVSSSTGDASGDLWKRRCYGEA